MSQAIALLVGQLVIEAIKRVDYKLLADVFEAIQPDVSEEIDKLLVLARLEALSLESTTAAALKATEAIHESP